MKDGSQYLKISVIDSGVGIAKDNQDKLFKLFGFLEDNQEMNTNGIGLGLMISKLIVEKFDGNITFESEPEKGSKFMFTFKLEQADDQSLQSESSHRQYEHILNNKNLIFNWKPKATRGENTLIAKFEMRPV